MTALGSGSHHWVVDTGSNQDWLLGVASLSVSRESEICARPENGFWTLCFRGGELRAMTSPPTPLTATRTPKQVKVQLDYNKGTLSFFDPADDTLIYAFTHTFTEPLLPYFYTQSSHPLRIMPEKVLVTMLRQWDDLLCRKVGPQSCFGGWDQCKKNLKMGTVGLTSCNINLSHRGHSILLLSHFAVCLLQFVFATSSFLKDVGARLTLLHRGSI